MSILINKDTKVITQGITGKTGQFHTRMCRDYANGKNCFVAGVNPKRAGEDFEGIPIYASVKEAKAETGATVSVIYVPPAGAADAIWEAVDADLDLVICITEGIPTLDMLDAKVKCDELGVRLIGPNCPGIISPAQANLGITPADITGPGRLGLVSKSGTLTYQLMYELRDFGFTTCLGIGGDPVVGTTHIDALAAFEADPDTDLVIMIGEIGGDAEERAAAWIQENMTKPVVAYIAGFTAPEGKTMGHAGAIVSGSSGTAAAKAEALEAVGVRVGRTPSQTAQIAREILSR